MEVRVESRGVSFRIGDYFLDVEFRAFGGFDVYLDHMWIPVDTPTLERIINEERLDLLERLRRLGLDFKDPKTRAKYYEAYLEGDFRKSKELTVELENRATYKGVRAFGFEIEEPKGWLFVGSEGNGEWRLIFISADLKTLRTRCENDLLAKRMALKILEGEGRIVKEWYGGSPTTMDCWILGLIFKAAEKWKMSKLKELLGAMRLVLGEL